MEDPPKALVTGEANVAAPRRHGGLQLGLLTHDDDDDVFDEDAGEGPTDEVADEPARGAREVETRDERFLSPELLEYVRAFAATHGRAGVEDEETQGRVEDGDELGGEYEDGAGNEKAGKKRRKNMVREEGQYKSRKAARRREGSQGPSTSGECR